MTKRMVFLLVASLLVFGGVVGAKLFMNRMMNQFFDNMPIPAAVVSSFDAKADRWVQAITSVGTISAKQGADLTTQVSGIVEKIHFENGSSVKAGDLIITLDSATDKADLATLQAAARLAELERDRVQRLLKTRSISKSEYDKRQNELEQAEARVTAQQKKMEQKEVHAPYSGRLGIRQMNVGQYVNAGDPIISLQSLDSVFVDFTLPEQRYSDVKVGMTIEAQMDALGDTVFTGTITAIEPAIDADTRNFKLQATFQNTQHLLRPGMFARVSMDIGDAKEVTVIPQTAISYSPYGDSVYILTDSGNKQENGQSLFNVKQRFVRTGESRGDLISITDGLQLGETVASSGLLKLRSGGTALINNDIQPDSNVAPTPDNG